MLIIALAIFGIPETAFAQARRVTNNNNATRTSTQRTNPPAKQTSAKKKDERKKDTLVYYTLAQDSLFAHWSIGGGIGVSIFDGDIRETHKRVVPTAFLDWAFAGNIERTFNPIWGLGVEYVYIPYGADPDGTTNEMRGTAHEWDVYLSVNMLNLFYRTRPQKWGIFLNIGMGMSHYNAKMRDTKTGMIVKDADGHPMDLKGGIALGWPLVGLVEYNLSKYWAIGLKGEYRLHDKDNYEGFTVNIRKGNWNDAFELFTLTARYKPHFGKDYHVRNYSYGDLNMKDLNKRLADMENMIKDMSKPDLACCVDNAEEIEKLKEQLKQKPDTVVVMREVETIVTPPPTAPEEIKKVFNEALRGIQFETAKADIKPVSFTILDNVVRIMKENPGFNLDIIGHTDNVGSAQSNLDLSDRRAYSVRMYLMNHGIEGTRLTSIGRGLTQPIATNSTPEGRALNRRVEFVVKQGGVVLFKSE